MFYTENRELPTPSLVWENRILWFHNEVHRKDSSVERIHTKLMAEIYELCFYLMTAIEEGPIYISAIKNNIGYIKHKEAGKKVAGADMIITDINLKTGIMTRRFGKNTTGKQIDVKDYIFKLTVAQQRLASIICMGEYE